MIKSNCSFCHHVFLAQAPRNPKKSTPPLATCVHDEKRTCRKAMPLGQPLSQGATAAEEKYTECRFERFEHQSELFINPEREAVSFQYGFKRSESLSESDYQILIDFRLIHPFFVPPLLSDIWGKMRMAQGCSVASLLNCADNSGAKPLGLETHILWVELLPQLGIINACLRIRPSRSNSRIIAWSYFIGCVLLLWSPQLAFWFLHCFCVWMKIVHVPSHVGMLLGSWTPPWGIFTSLPLLALAAAWTNSRPLVGRNTCLRHGAMGPR